MPNPKMLYISMLGETSLYNPDDYRSLCPSGLEKDWILAWHSDLAKHYQFDMLSVDIVRGDDLPVPEGIDSVILGGTIHLVLEDKPWLRMLRLWLVEYRKLRRPLLGICGGHQLTAVNFCDGNALKKRINGPMFGTYEIQLTAAGKDSPLFQNLTGRISFHFANSYHVISHTQVDMTILATTHDSPAVAVDYGDHWYGSQFHPESRRETWECEAKQEPRIDLRRYKIDHDGIQLLENFVNISRGVYLNHKTGP
jgi:GMP synthase-like glutamine amidotransferase